ncbi:ferritin-like domain-containing protein [Nocardia neocaledoniensis]|uniref:ferritin-like domain-containing protein n=1 Tax=Nocardia neocaledoniensis TaxID=236511 RepID=UPI00245430F9|nr:ferritin-like domain-containing protein [Nocardia neocaledoniensis]
MSIDLPHTLEIIKQRQWALGDFDWGEPGADTIAAEQLPQVKQFMSDLVWIEQVGSRAFVALGRQTKDSTLAEIYRYFQAEEQKHANAELALMRRWGMLDDDEIPEPNINIRLAIEWLDSYADDLPLSVLGSAIPMLEVALDGALLKFLLEEIQDPLCHKVFQRINADESRHLAVDFHVLDMIGAGPIHRLLIEAAGAALRPSLLIGILTGLPLLTRMHDSIIAMGLDEQMLFDAIRKFGIIGDRSVATRRNPIYQLVKYYGEMVMDQSHPYHRLLGNALLTITEHYPKQWLGSTPSWINELTYQPVAAA